MFKNVSTTRAARVATVIAGLLLVASPLPAQAQRVSIADIQDSIDSHDASVQGQLGLIQSTLSAPLTVTTQTELNGRSAFSARISVPFGEFRDIPTSDRVAGDDFAVPVGSVLVIEHITLRATTATADQVGFVEARVATNGTTISHVLPVALDQASLPVGSAQKIDTYGWPVKLYADGGSEVVLNLNSTVGSPGGAAVYTVSGYLVPAASPTLGP